MTTVQEQDIYTSNLYVKFIFFIRQFGLVNNNAFLTMTLSLPKWLRVMFIARPQVKVNFQFYILYYYFFSIFKPDLKIASPCELFKEKGLLKIRRFFCLLLIECICNVWRMHFLMHINKWFIYFLYLCIFPGNIRQSSSGEEACEKVCLQK